MNTFGNSYRLILACLVGNFEALLLVDGVALLLLFALVLEARLALLVGHVDASAR